MSINSNGITHHCHCFFFSCHFIYACVYSQDEDGNRVEINCALIFITVFDTFNVFKVIM